MKRQEHSRLSRLGVLLLALLMIAMIAVPTFTAYADETSAASEPEETMVTFDVEQAAETEKLGDSAPAGDTTTTGTGDSAKETASPAAQKDDWTCKVCGEKQDGGEKCSKCEYARHPATKYSIIALVILVIVIAIGFIKKVNLGFLGIGAAFILALIAGIDPKYVPKAFDGDMFVTLVGVTFLFGMASQNGTLDLFSKKVVALVGKRTVLIPILMFFLSAFISAIGPGHIAAGILMTTFAVYLAFEMKINPITITTALFSFYGLFGS